MQLRTREDVTEFVKLDRALSLTSKNYEISMEQIFAIRARFLDICEKGVAGKPFQVNSNLRPRTYSLLVLPYQ